ncbi:hypothetical protein DFS33DRAFT_198942 [Desarmillaria ectypa]|nr:hypothetical protein DFS33DRAFT_198942 [Desarmillaria ectypa]
MPSPPLSSVGKKKLLAHLFLLLVSIVVLGLSIQVNKFQEWFYVADIFPFALSLISLVLLAVMLCLDLILPGAPSFTSKPFFEIVAFTIMSILWLAFSAFSTSRWQNVPLSCQSIPEGLSSMRFWCKNLQALKVFVWIEWLLFLSTALLTLRFVLIENSRGHKHVFEMALSRYSASYSSDGSNHKRGDSEFLQYGEFT